MKKFGMTLAEVLVTLAIVGVVAAVSLPNLIVNAQVTELESHFRKTMNDLESFSKIFLQETSMSVPLYASTNGVASFYNEFPKYMAKSTKTSNWTHANSSTVAIPYQLKSLTDAMGASRSVDSLGSNNDVSICDATGFIEDGNGRVFWFDDAPLRGFNGPRVCVDINGKKKPNTYGLDVFSFLFTTDGSIIPEGMYHKNSNVTAEVYNFDDQVGYAWKSGTATGEKNCYESVYGQTCAHYANLDINPRNSKQSYWKDFVGKKQYLTKDPL